MNEIAARLPATTSYRAQLRRLWRLMGVLVHIGRGFGLALWHQAWRNPHRPRIRLVARQWLRDLLHILGVEVRVHGRLPDRAMLLVSNHVSWLDIPVIGAVQGVHFLSKAEVRDWPLIGPLAAAAGTLFIRRGSGDSRAKSTEIASHLSAGRPVLIFPEGTTTDGLTVRRFHGRLFEAAIQANVPVQPLALRYKDADGCTDTTLAFIGDDAFHTHLWRLLLRDRVQVELHYAPALPVASEMQRDQLCQAARQGVVAGLR